MRPIGSLVFFREVAVVSLNHNVLLVSLGLIIIEWLFSCGGVASFCNFEIR